MVDPRPNCHGPKFSQFHAVFRNILESCMLASAPPQKRLTSVSTENFESVPEKCVSSTHVSPQIPPHQVKTPFNLNASSTNNSLWAENIKASSLSILWLLSQAYNVCYYLIDSQWFIYCIIMNN